MLTEQLCPPFVLCDRCDLYSVNETVDRFSDSLDVQDVPTLLSTPGAQIF